MLLEINKYECPSINNFYEIWHFNNKLNSYVADKRLYRLSGMSIGDREPPTHLYSFKSYN